MEKRDCKYVKLKCRGHGETPSQEQVSSFIELVDGFIASNSVDIIAVHCTHGFNRTGFLITSYLVEKYDFAVAAALQTFATARPPGIYKQDYINELFKRYGDVDEDEKDDIPLAPELPEWCHGEEESADDYNFTNPHKRSREQYEQSSSDNNHHDNNDEDNEEEAENEDGQASTTSQSPRKKKRRNENIRLDATFMPGISNVTLMTDKQVVNSLQHLIQDMCGFKGSGFPGSQPVSMDRNNIKFLSNKPYKVSWKADGVRYMMLVKDKDEIYFFDRDNSCFKVDDGQLCFPSIQDLGEHLKNTLMDGEMVIDKHQGLNMPRYLIYDIIRYENEHVGKKTFGQRLDIIKTKVIEARVKALQQGLIRREREPFGVRLKDFWDVMYARSLLGEKFAKQLSHEPDGLIFQPGMEPYTCGRCDDVLKWKPGELNSVDFKLVVATETGIG